MKDGIQATESEGEKVTTETIEYIRCPECGWEGELDECDVLGADDGNVFCGNWRVNGEVCSAEITVETNTFIPVVREKQKRLFE